MRIQSLDIRNRAAGIVASLTLCAAVPAAAPAPMHPDEAGVLANVHQLTHEGMGLTKAGEAYFSPDSRSIIFQAWPTGQSEYQIYAMPLDGDSPRMVSTGRGACTCAFFHPGGKKILFASTHLGPNDGLEDGGSEGYNWTFHQHMDIFEADLDGSNLRRLTDTPGYDAEGSYSADGSSIVFTSQRDGDLELYIMNADGSNPRRLTHAAGYDGGPFLSPDGLSVLFRADRRNDGKMNLQLRIVGADGRNDRAITDNAIFNWCPYWHPSGTCFIFTQTDHEAYSRGGRPNYDLFMMDLGGGRLTRISHDPEFDGLPVFSADGRRLMWTSKRGGLQGAQIFIADFTLPPPFKTQP